MNILVGTDFSPNAVEAVQVAGHLARRFNDTVELVHATLPPITEGLPVEIWAPVETKLQERVTAEARQLQELRIKATGRVEIGSAADVLRQLARPGQTRLVVVSSVGRVALARVLLGSTAERVAETVAVPTLVIRSTAPFHEWSEGRRTLRLFVAADFTTSSDAALAAAGEFARHGPCEITVGCVAPNDEAATAGEREAQLRALQRDLSDKVRAILGDLTVKQLVEVASASIPATLIELAKTAQADVLVAGTHQHHGLSRLWHRSTSRTLLGDAPMSVLCVPVSNHLLSQVAIPPLNRVLVTTDFSPLGNRAVAAACALLPNGGRLRLLHVMAPEQSPLPLPRPNERRPSLSPGEQERLLRGTRRRLGSLLPAEAVGRGIQVEVVVTRAQSVPEAVLEQAEQFGAHVICLSSHGRSGIVRAVFGSVAGEVVARSHRPVHLVRISPP